MIPLCYILLTFGGFIGSVALLAQQFFKKSANSHASLWWAPATVFATLSILGNIIFSHPWRILKLLFIISISAGLAIISYWLLHVVKPTLATKSEAEL